MSADSDYYALLGVTRDADDKIIKSAYRKLAMQYHPDRNPGDAEAEAKFLAIGEAYDVLKDPQKRAAYDRFGKAAFEGGGFGGGGRGGAGMGGFEDLGDIFESFFGDAFGGGAGGGGRRGPARGADLRYDMEVTLEEAYHGTTKEIVIEVAASCDTCDGTGAKPGTSARTCNLCHGRGKVRAQQGFFVVERTCGSCHGRGEVIDDPCRTCRGEGRVDRDQNLEIQVPPGVDNGTRIRLSGKGEAGLNGAPAGDLYIFMHIARHDIFERDGTTLLTRAPISFTKAALGGDIEIPGLDGKVHKISIPVGIQSGKQLRQRGAGMPVLQGRGTGDMIIQIDVETPTKLSSKQKELLRAFQETETGDETPQSSGFFSKIKDIFDA